MTTRTLQTVADRLSDASVAQYVNPYTYIEWPEGRDADAWYMTPELVSLAPTESYSAASAQQQRDLAFFETVNFFSLNIHGEKHLIAELAKRLYRPDHSSVTAYLQHFLDEENKHMTYFGGFCNRYAGKVYGSRKMEFPRDYVPGEEDFLFFAKVLIFEEIVDVYNRRVGKDERVAEIARRINWIHHQEELRHLAFGREMVKELYRSHAEAWGTEKITELGSYLAGYLKATWREYYNPDMYADAGFGEPYELAGEAWQAGAAHRTEISQKLLQYFAKLDMHLEEGLA